MLSDIDLVFVINVVVSGKRLTCNVCRIAVLNYCFQYIRRNVSVHRDNSWVIFDDLGNDLCIVTIGFPFF